MKHFEAELLNKEGWFQVRPEVEVKKVGTPAGEETFILCRSTGRKEKEKAIRNQQVSGSIPERGSRFSMS